MGRVRRRAFLQAVVLAAASCRFRGKMGSGNGRKVIVVGAGMAGLGAARALTDGGFDVQIVEGRDRIGGRVWTDRSLGLPIDLGASWIHESMGNPIKKLARQHGVKTFATDYTSMHLWDFNGRKVGDGDVRELLRAWEDVMGEAAARAEASDTDISVEESLRRALKGEELDDFEERALRWRKRGLESEAGEDLSVLSMWGDDEESGFLGDDLIFPGGYHQIVAAVAKGLEIQKSTTVREVRTGSNGVEVVTEGGTLEAEFAVVTLPLGVLKAGTVKFTPDLPAAKKTAIAGLGMGVLNKVALRFPRRFWPADRHFLSVLANAPREVGVFLDWSTVTGKPVLLAFSGGTLAREIGAASEASVQKRVMAVLRRALGKKIPNPTSIKRTAWSRDPFAGGSYSHQPVGVSGRLRDDLAAPHGRIHFAGEATTRVYPATVHGAWLSGLREAERIAERL